MHIFNNIRPKVDRRFKLFTFTSFVFTIFFFLMYQRQKKCVQLLMVALKFSFTSGFVFSKKLFKYIVIFVTKDFPLWNNLSFTQTMLIFYTQRSVLVFLNINLDFLVQTSFSSMLVGNDHNLIVAKMFLTSDCNWSRTQKHLVRKQALNHLAKLGKWLSSVLSTYLYGAFDCMYLSCHVRISEWIHTL